MYNRPLNRLTSFVKILIMVSLMGGIAACGGGGAKAPSTGQPSTGGPGTIPGTDPGATATADSVQLLVSSQTMPSAGGKQVDLTAVVLNANGRALTDKAVTLAVVDSATSGKAFLTNVPDKTDAKGLLIGTLNLGTNKANRTITIRATADSATATNTVDVVGTSITIGGATSLVSNATTPITVSLKDSGGNPLQGEIVTLTSLQGNALSSAAPVTNRSGQVVVDVTGTRAGPPADTITATALGASSTTSIEVSGSDFSFITPSPASNTDVSVNIDQPIAISWKEGNAAQNGLPITLSATRGSVTVTSPSGLTDVNGVLTATIRSTSAGPTTIQASSSSGKRPSTSLNFIFVTRSATAVNVQADRTTIPINTAGSDTNRATITAIVRDGASNLVKNARVQFQIVTDTTGGRLSGTEDITDVSGAATVDYIAGTTSSQNEGVLIKAIVIDVGGIIGAVTPANLSNSVKLTVAGQSLFIRLSTDNKVTSVNPNFTKLFSALVTDAAGNPVPNTRVQFELKPAQPPLHAYSKGAYFVTGTAWVKGNVALCFNEDLNLNGVLDALVSEDTNYNGILDSGEDVNLNGIIDGRTPSAIEVGDAGGALLPSEDIAQANGILDPGEDIARTNGILDPGEDANSNNILDPGEDQPRLNGILEPGEDLPSIPPNGVLDANEDVFRNGKLDPAETLHKDGIVDVNEDFNHDGSLTPGNVATTTSNINTDALGFATTTVAYTQNFATWATVTLTAKITVAGSETTSSVTFTLPGLAADYTNTTAEPPGRISPFGQRRNCKSRF